MQLCIVEQPLQNSNQGLFGKCQEIFEVQRFEIIYWIQKDAKGWKGLQIEYRCNWMQMEANGSK